MATDDSMTVGSEMGSDEDSDSTMGLNELPTEVLLYLCEHLDTWQLLELRGVCKRLNETVSTQIECEIAVFMEAGEVKLGFDGCICSEFSLDALKGTELADGLRFWVDRLNKVSFMGLLHTKEERREFNAVLKRVLYHLEESTAHPHFYLDLSLVNFSKLPERKSMVEQINESKLNFETWVRVKVNEEPILNSLSLPHPAILGPKFTKIMFVCDDDDGGGLGLQKWFKFDGNSRLDYVSFTGVCGGLAVIDGMLRDCQNIRHVRILFSRLIVDDDVNVAELWLRHSEVVEVFDSRINIGTRNKETTVPCYFRDLKIEDLALLQLFNYNFPKLETLSLRDRTYFDDAQSIYSTAEFAPLLGQLKKLELWLQDWTVCDIFQTKEFTNCSLRSLHLSVAYFDLTHMLRPFKTPPHLQYLSIESKSPFQCNWNQLTEDADDLLSTNSSFLQLQFHDPLRSITIPRDGKIILNGMPMNE